MGRPVAVREEEGGDEGDDGEAEHGHRAGDPTQLGSAPCEGEHAGADDGRYDVRDAGPYRP